MKAREPIFKGSGVALITPFDERNRINIPKYKQLIDFHLNNGTDAIIVAGTTGEASTLSDEEQLGLVDEVVRHVKGRIPVIAGTGSNDTRHGVELSRNAAKLGVDGLLIVTPYYNKTSQEGLVAHYRLIAENVYDKPIILYNVPGRTGMTIKPETYYELSRIPNIVATKEASGDIEHIRKVRDLCLEYLDIYSGNDDQIADIVSLGGIGVISVSANILPKETHSIAITGNHQEQEYFNPLFNDLFIDVNPIPIKEAMNILGMEVGECRLPLIRMNAEKQKVLRKTMSQYSTELQNKKLDI